MIWLAVSIGGVFLTGLLAWSLRMNRQPNDTHPANRGRA